MKDIAPAIAYALFVWWFTTGLVFISVLRKRATARLSLIGAAILFPVSLCALAISAAHTGLAAVYVAFSASVVLWGTQEVGFLTGFLTGPRPLACPPGATGLARASYAIKAILYHEVALIVSGLAVVAVTWHGANQFGALTFLVLYVMRVSAKLNLFLGVPVLNDEIMPADIVHLRSYFRRGPVNAFFPIAMLLSVLMMVFFIDAAGDPDASFPSETGYTLVAALTALAILEHVFMLVQLPVEKLWRWSTRLRGDGSGESRPDKPIAHHVRPDQCALDHHPEHAVPTRI
jgi:putative photosynthetic complex assembly protein 2